MEGFHLLTRMPTRGEVSDEVEQVLQGRLRRPKPLRPKPFKDGVSEKKDFRSKKHILLLHFETTDGSKEFRDEWARWFDSFAPTNDNVYDYISSHDNYRCPFSSFFESDTCYYGRTDHWSKPVEAAIFPSATVVSLPTSLATFPKRPLF